MESKVKKIQSILVPHDFTIVADNALEQAIIIAQQNNANILLLHVVSNAKSIEVLDKKLQEISNSTSYSNYKILVEQGDIYSTINEVAQQNEVDIIIMGTHGKKGMQKLLGSNALKVIDSTNIPLLIVQENMKQIQFKNILFPVSLQDEDRQKTASAVKLAKMFGSKIHIFPRFESTKTGEKKIVNAILQIKSYFKKYDIDFEVAPLLKTQSNFQKKILAYASEISADLILIINDSADHLPLISPKEEEVIFNKLEIPVLCIQEQKSKKVQFSVAN